MIKILIFGANIAPAPGQRDFPRTEPKDVVLRQNKPLSFKKF
jgi:hypothetical protein